VQILEQGGGSCGTRRVICFQGSQGKGQEIGELVNLMHPIEAAFRNQMSVRLFQQTWFILPALLLRKLERRAVDQSVVPSYQGYEIELSRDLYVATY
jgi:hypothetical protein